MKYGFSITVLVLFLGGCSSTWDGVKQDSSKIWKATKEETSDVYHSTKKTIHDATADETSDKTADE